MEVIFPYDIWVSVRNNGHRVEDMVKYLVAGWVGEHQHTLVAVYKQMTSDSLRFVVTTVEDEEHYADLSDLFEEEHTSRTIMEYRHE